MTENFGKIFGRKIVDPKKGPTRFRPRRSEKGIGRETGAMAFSSGPAHERHGRPVHVDRGIFGRRCAYISATHGVRQSGLLPLGRPPWALPT